MDSKTEIYLRILVEDEYMLTSYSCNRATHTAQDNEDKIPVGGWGWKEVKGAEVT